MAEVIRQYWKSANKPTRQHLGGSFTSSLIPDGTMFWHRLTARFSDEESSLLTTYGGWDEHIKIIEGLAGVLKWVRAADEWDGEQTTMVDPL